jgi:hypothetical protein
LPFADSGSQTCFAKVFRFSRAVETGARRGALLLCTPQANLLTRDAPNSTRFAENIPAINACHQTTNLGADVRIVHGAPVKSITYRKSPFEKAKLERFFKRFWFR